MIVCRLDQNDRCTIAGLMIDTWESEALHDVASDPDEGPASTI